ncbi:MAG: DUF4013 domain-containing protein [Chloroflexi bacterium]|nr:DUF4013 domain-containing protein [Chloroflexota bacterium]
MDIGNIIGRAFRDKDWIVKILIGGVFTIIPFLNFISEGFYVDLMRKRSEGDDVDLPSFDNMGDQFVRGLISWLISLVYQLPGIVLFGCFAIVSAIAGGNSRNGGGNGPAMVLAIICLMLPGLVLSLIGAILAPAGRLQYAVTGSMAAGFQLSTVWAFISQNIGEYVIALLGPVGLGLALAVISPFTCFLIVPFGTFWINLVLADMLGNLYHQSHNLDSGMSPVVTA